MNKHLMIVAAVGAAAALAFYLIPRSTEHEVPPPVAAPDAAVAPVVGEGGTLTHDGRAMIPPAHPPETKVKPHVEETPKEEPKPPPDIDEKDSPLVGLEVEEPTSAELTELKVPEGMTGVVIKRVDPASPAAEARLEKGDVIVRAQRDKITGETSLRTSVADRDHTVLTIYRNGFPLQVVLHKPFHPDE